MPNDMPFRFEWRVEGIWLISPVGTRVAKFEDGALRLYDKLTRTDFRFTLEDFQRLSGHGDSGVEAQVNYKYK